MQFWNKYSFCLNLLLTLYSDTLGMYISIVIPALNEELTIAKVIKAAKQGLKKSKVVGEIIVADNGSTDRTAQISRKLGARVCAVSEKGYGSALWVALLPQRAIVLLWAMLIVLMILQL